jgi:hypothetical protein
MEVYVYRSDNRFVAFRYEGLSKEVKEVLKAITSRHGKYRPGYTFYTTLYRKHFEVVGDLRAAGFEVSVNI